jgi:hypothetical protein
MAWIEGLGYSWANWSVYDKNESASAIASGGSSGYWQESQLTASGKFVRKMMKGFGSGSSITQMGLTQPSYPSCSIFDSGSTFEFVRDGEGEFKVAINAENYNDSLNIQSIQDVSVHAFQDIYVITSADGAWAKYKMNNVPADGYYRLAFRYQAPNKNVEISYTVDGVAGTNTLKLDQTPANTFKVNSSAIGLKEGTSYITFNLGGVSASDLLFDAFWAAPMDSADSVQFGFLEVDESGNRIVHDKPIEKVEGIAGIRPVNSLQVNLHGRVMEVYGNTRDVSVGVLDMQGRVLLRKQMQGAGAIDLSGLQPGTYIVQMKGAGTSETKRIQLR